MLRAVRRHAHVGFVPGSPAASAAICLHVSNWCRILHGSDGWSLIGTPLTCAEYAVLDHLDRVGEGVIGPGGKLIYAMAARGIDSDDLAAAIERLNRASLIGAERLSAGAIRFWSMTPPKMLEALR